MDEQEVREGTESHSVRRKAAITLQGDTFSDDQGHSSDDQEMRIENQVDGTGYTSEQTSASTAANLPASEHSSTSKGIQVGFHSLDSLEGVDLPEYVRQHNTTLSFPEKLMLMLTHVERQSAKFGKGDSAEPISWAFEGKAFVIRNKELLVAKLLPLFFGHAKFTSFTRKLYRWGFRKVNFSSEQPGVNDIFFANENFQRDNKALMSKMRSVTAAKTRSELEGESKRQALQLGEPSTQLAQMLQQTDAASQASSLLSLAHLRTQAAIGGLQASAIDTSLLQHALESARLQHDLATRQHLPVVQSQEALLTQRILSLAGLNSPSVQSPQITLPYLPSSAAGLVNQSGATRQYPYIPQQARQSGSEEEEEQLRDLIQSILRNSRPPP